MLSFLAEASLIASRSRAFLTFIPIRINKSFLDTLNLQVKCIQIFTSMQVLWKTRLWVLKVL